MMRDEMKARILAALDETPDALLLHVMIFAEKKRRQGEKVEMIAAYRDRRLIQRGTDFAVDAELSDAELAHARPFVEVFPEMASRMRRQLRKEDAGRHESDSGS
jgi:hypothetical protein